MAEYNFAPITGGNVQRPASTTEAMYRTISYWKDPLVAMFKYNDGANRQKFDRSLDPIFAPIATELYMVPTLKEFETKKDLYLKELADAKTYANSSNLQVLGTGILDPLGAVPFFRGAKAATLLGSASRSAVEVGTVVGGIEVARSQTIPNYSVSEGVFNTATGMILGGFIGSAGYGVKKGVQNHLDNAHRRLGEHQQTILEMENFVENEAILKDMVQGQRLLGQIDEKILRAESIVLTNRINGKQATIDRIQNGQLNLSPLAITAIEDDIARAVSERQNIVNELNLRRLDEGLTMADDPYSVASSFFDWVDIMPTPAKTIGRYKAPANASPQLKEALNRLKKTSLLLAGDSSMLYAGQKLGLTLPPSVHVQGAARKAELASMENRLVKIWKEETDATIGSNVARRFSGGKTLDEWLNSVNAKRIAQDPNMTAKEIEAADIINNHFNKARTEAEAHGVIGSGDFIESRILVKEGQIYEARAKLDESRSKNQTDRIDYWESKLKTLEDDLGELENSLQYIKSGPIRPAGPNEPYYTRIWNSDRVAADEKGPKELRRKLTDWVRANPYGVEYNNKSGLYEPKDLTGDLQAQSNYVDSIIKSILSDNEPATSTTSRSTNYPSRQIAIPNSMVMDFINTDVRDVMRTYTIRIGSKIDFAKQFGNRSFKDLGDELVGDLVDNGMSLADANKLRKELTILYQRVTGTVVSNPASLTNKLVQRLKEFTSLNYLGSAGPTAFGDIPKIIMENGFKDVLRGAFATFDSAAWKKQITEFRLIYGEGLELALGSVQQQILEDTGTQVGSRAWNSIKDLGFILNGLGPMTVGLKSFSGALSVHKFLDIAGRVADGSASKFDLEYVSRYGLSIKQLKEIASTAPIEKTDNGLKLANIDNWAGAGVSTETIASFKSAVANNVNNTIISSSPNTRFTYADGKIYLPIDKARKLMPNIQEAEDFPGYVVWENSVMTLPFMFYNWSMSAVTNILQTTAQGQIKSRYAGFASMLAYGYMMAKIRTPEWAWDDMDYDQKFAAAVERSGIGSIYADVAINSIRATTQLGINDPDNDMLRLSYYGNEGYGEAATTILGAGASNIKDFIDASGKMASGDYGEAIKDFYLMLPLTELFWLKQDSRAMIDYATSLGRR